MKTKLSFFLLFIAFSAIGLQAKNSSPEQEINGNQTISSLSLLADTLAIPWREDFESITRENDFPYGMSYTYGTGSTKPILTFMAPNATINKERVKARNGNSYMVFSSACNDWVFTPGLFLRAGTEYTFSFWCDSMHVSWKALEAKVGFSPTSKGMIISVTDSMMGPASPGYRKYEGSFIAAKDAIYYFGIHAVSTIANHFLPIDDLEVSTTPPAHKAVNLFLRNVTNTSIDFYRVYTPVATTMVLSYRKVADAASWDFIDVSNQEKICLSGLEAATNYEARLGTLYSAADTLWTSVSVVKTLANPVDPGGVFPVNLNFDGTDVAWYLMNDSASPTLRNYNKWYIDSVGGKIIQGRTVAYISGNAGISNTYSKTYNSSPKLYTQYFLFPEAEEFFFSFSYRSFTTATNDYLKVDLLTPTFNIFTNLRTDSNMTTKTAVLPGTYSNTVRQLLFTWQSFTAGTGSAYPAVIDSVILRSLTCGTPSGLSAKKILDNNILFKCTAIMGNNASFEIAYKEKGTPESSWMIKGGLLKMDSLLLDGLNPNTNYDIKIRKRYGIDSSFWTSSIQVRTALPLTEPGLTEDFENFNTLKCIIANGAQSNKWIVGSNVEGASGKTIYISKDNGATNQYNDTVVSIVHFYYDLNFVQAEIFRLSFDWKGLGQLSDFLRVSLVDVGVTPVAGTMLPFENRMSGKDFYNRRTWATEEILFDKTYTGTQKRLVFTWKNIASAGSLQPAIAIDNIRFEANNCSTPENLMLIGSNQTSVALMAEKPATGTTFIVNYKKAGPFEEWNTQTISPSAFFSEDKFNLTQLDTNANYEIKVRKQCGSDTSLFTLIVIARTIQVPASLPLSENFENEANTSKWLMLNAGQINQWIVGNAVSNEGSKSLYITNQSKTGNTYDPTSRSIVHFYRDVTFGDATEYVLTFTWKGGNANSFMSVYIAGINQTLQAGTLDSRGSYLDGVRYSGSNEWKSEYVVITRADQLANSTRSLVFTWVCDGTGGEQVPFAIDNIELKPIKCPYPKDLEFVSFPISDMSDKVEIRFTDEHKTNNYVVKCINLEDNSVTLTQVNNTQPVITGLKAYTDYELKISALCSQGKDSSRWTDGVKFSMPQQYAALPFTENFEEQDSVKLWTRVNGENPNKWFFGSATAAPGLGNRAAYIDSLDENTNACKSGASTVHLYRDIDFPVSDEKNFYLDFQWKEQSKETTPNYSYLRISVVDMDVWPVAGEEISKPLYASPNIFSTNENVVWNKETLVLPKNLLSGTKKRLVFSWKNAEQNLPTPPVAIDNVVVAVPGCNVPENLRYKALSPDSVQLNWTCKYAANNRFRLKFENKPEPEPNYITDTSIVLNLNSNTLYSVSITNECGVGYNFPIKINFRTDQQVPVLPFTEKFDIPANIKEWIFVNGNNPNKWIAGEIKSTEEGADIQTAAFVSTDGENNFYYGIDSSKNITSIIHLYRDVFFDSTDKLALSFDWRAIGNIASDYMRVYLADSNVTPVLNTLVDKKYEIVAPDSMIFALKRLWKTEHFTIKGVRNTKKRLIFSWINKQLTKDVIQPPVAFSNLNIKAIDCTTPSELAFKNYLEPNSAVLTWKNVGTNYILKYKEVGKSVKWDSIEVNNRNFDTLDFDLMEENTPYEVQVMNNCGGRSIWSPSFYFNTLQRLDIPFSEDFAEPENREQWKIVNGTELNSWYIDTAVHAKGKGSYSAYISNNGGRTNTYTIFNPESSIVHLYRDINILPNQKELQLLMDWKGYGEPTNKDYMQVYLLHKDSIPRAGSLPPATSLVISKYFGFYKHNWKRENIVVPAAGKLKAGRNRLVFTWVNNNIDGEQSPMAIDNIAINMFPCLSPTNITSTAIGRDTVVLKWNTQAETYNHFNIRYQKVEQGINSETWEEGFVANDSNYVLRKLTANRLYEIQVQTKCPSDTSAWKSYLVQTKQIPSNLPINEEFKNDTAYNAWTFANGEMPNAWFISSSSKYVYISDEGGDVYHYAGIVPAGSVSHFYKDITFPSAVEYLLSYQWMSVGESGDYLQVSLVDSTTPVNAGTAVAGDKLSNPLYENFGWTGGAALLPPDKISGKTKRLVFSWITNTTKAVQTPAAVDDIILRVLDCKTPTDLKLVDYPDLHSAKIEWTSAADTFTVAYGKVTDPQPWPEIGVRGNTTITLQGLDSNTLYYVKVKNSCAENTIFTNTVVIRTLNTPIAEFPYTETFEKDSTTKDKWLIVNGSQINAWYIGKNTAAKGGDQSMYISSNGGDSNIYALKKGTTHFYRDITFPASGNVEMSFDWKAQGNSSYDYLLLNMVDISKDPVEGEELSGILLGKYYGNATEWRTVTMLFPDSLKGKRKRLVFTWITKSNTDIYQPPSAVDNIAFAWFNCSSVQNLQTKVLSDEQVALSWQGAANATSYTISYKLLQGGNWIDEEVQSLETVLGGFKPNTPYIFRVALNCEAGLSKPIYDTALLAASIPFIEDFDTVPIGNWIKSTTSAKLSNTLITLTALGKGNWSSGYFANAAYASAAAKKAIQYWGYDWLVSPQIYLPPGIKTELEFKIAFTFANQPEGVPDKAAINDKFVVLVSESDNKWSAKDALLTWDNKGSNPEYSEISHTREGDKIKISLENYSGPVRIAFYCESVGYYVFNDVFIDSVIVRPIVCEKVQDVHVSKIGLDSAFVAWIASDEQYKWEVQCATMDGALLQTDELLELYNVELKALQMNTEYNVSVRSICNENDTSDWFIKKFTTKSTCANSPSAIEIVPTDSNAIVNWIADTEHVSWELRYGFSGQPKEQMSSIFTTTPSFTINNLTELTEYDLYIRAICEANHDTSNWANKKVFTTHRTPCIGVSNVAVSTIKTNSAVITWEAPQGQQHWEVRYGSQAADINAMNKYFVTETNYTLSNLNPNATYEVVVRSICRADDSSLWSDRKQFTTQDCGTVSNLLVVKNTNGNSAELSWTAKPEHTKWRIGIDTNNNFSTAREEEITKNPYTIDYAHWSIEKTKSYYISIKALCGSHLVDTWSDQAVLTKGEGIDDLDNARIQVNLSPNPANDYTKLSIYGAEGVVNVQIYSVKGELILTEKLNCTPENTKDLVIKGLQRGAYTLRIVHEKWTRTEKLIMQ